VHRERHAILVADAMRLIKSLQPSQTEEALISACERLVVLVQDSSELRADIHQQHGLLHVIGILEATDRPAVRIALLRLMSEARTGSNEQALFYRALTLTLAPSRETLQIARRPGPGAAGGVRTGRRRAGGPAARQPAAAGGGPDGRAAVHHDDGRRVPQVPAIGAAPVRPEGKQMQRATD